MRGLGKTIILAGVSLCPATVSAAAITPYSLDPYAEVLADLGSDYPHGPHLDLTIFATRPTHPCTTPEPAGGIYGQAIHVPNDDRPARLFLEWGERVHPDEANLEVTDACAGFGGPEDVAVLSLPERAAGYAAFARRLRGAPVDELGRILDPEPGYVMARGPDAPPLLFLGVVNVEGVFTVTDQVFLAPAGPHTPREVTSLFSWTGMVCYPFGLPDRAEEIPGSTVTEECCELAEADDGEAADLVGTCGLDFWDDSRQDSICRTEWLPCVDYSATETWVFNIPGVGDSSWGVDHNGARELQIRFYPLPLEKGSWSPGGP